MGKLAIIIIINIHTHLQLCHDACSAKEVCEFTLEPISHAGEHCAAACDDDIKRSRKEIQVCICRIVKDLYEEGKPVNSFEEGPGEYHLSHSRCFNAIELRSEENLRTTESFVADRDNLTVLKSH